MNIPSSHPAAIRSLTPAQYDLWARQARVSVGAVMAYHGFTGMGPKKGARRVNPILEFPGLLQLHAFHELFDASLEAAANAARAEREMRDAIAKYTRAKELAESIERTRAHLGEAFRSMTGLCDLAPNDLSEAF